MEVLFYLVPLALALGLVGLGGFLWSMKNGQFDDLDHAAWHAILDDELPQAGTRPPKRPSTAPGMAADVPLD